MTNNLIGAGRRMRDITSTQNTYTLVREGRSELVDDLARHFLLVAPHVGHRHGVVVLQPRQEAVRYDVPVILPLLLEFLQLLWGALLMLLGGSVTAICKGEMEDKYIV